MNEDCNNCPIMLHQSEMLNDLKDLTRELRLMVIANTDLTRELSKLIGVLNVSHG